MQHTLEYLRADAGVTAAYLAFRCSCDHWELSGEALRTKNRRQAAEAAFIRHVHRERARDSAGKEARS